MISKTLIGLVFQVTEYKYSIEVLRCDLSCDEYIVCVVISMMLNQIAQYPKNATVEQLIV